MADNTVFDSAFKTMMNKAPKLVIPLVNEAFGRHYDLDEAITQFSAEHSGLRGTVISDSVFRLQDRIYHVECQSTPDRNMVVRMIEYDFAIALEGALAGGAPYEMDFPESCVLFLRHAASTPDRLSLKVNLPGGDSFDYETKVVKTQLFTSDEIFEKHLLLLLPYYLMRYEESLAEIADDDARTSELVAECAELRASLEAETLGNGEPLLYEQLVELIIRVVDHMMAAQETLRKKVRRAMGGEVLELMRDRAERLEREALEQGIEQGIEQAVEGMSAKLREQGVDETQIEQAAAAIRSGRS